MLSLFVPSDKLGKTQSRVLNNKYSTSYTEFFIHLYYNYVDINYHFHDTLIIFSFNIFCLIFVFQGLSERVNMCTMVNIQKGTDLSEILTFDLNMMSLLSSALNVICAMLSCELITQTW